MNKAEALRQIKDLRLSSQEIAQKIYLATVEGVSGANQDDGQGFHLSALAELWNINGTLTNHNSSRRVITGRYRGRGVTFEQIYSVISQYPNGFSKSTPNFDDLVLGTTMPQRPLGSQPSAAQPSANDRFLVAIFAGVFLVCKIIFHWGWIISLILAAVVGIIYMSKHQ